MWRHCLAVFYPIGLLTSHLSLHVLVLLAKLDVVILPSAQTVCDFKDFFSYLHFPNVTLPTFQFLYLGPLLGLSLIHCVAGLFPLAHATVDFQNRYLRSLYISDLW